MPDAPHYREFAHGSAEYAAALILRQAELRTPLGLSYSPDDLAAESVERLFGAFVGAEIIATLNMRDQGAGVWKMRQVAVAPHWRGMGIGAALVRHAEQALAPSQIILHAREPVVPFYEKLGYLAEGPQFIEVTIPHRAMRKSFPQP
jgi:predicted GNAT family N-acyltransferase